MGQSKRKKSHRPPSRKHKKSPGQQQGQTGDTQKEGATSTPVERTDIEQQPQQTDPSNSQKGHHAPEYVYLVKIPKSNETYTCGSNELLAPGTYVVVPTRYGLDMAQVLGFVHSKMLSETVSRLDKKQKDVSYVDVEIPCVDCPGCENEQQVSPGQEPEVEQEQGDDLLIEAERREMFAQALEQEKTARDEELKHLDWIDRVVDEYDMAQFEENEQKAQEAFRICKEKISQHKLDMKLVGAHYLLTESKVLFFFTADNRVDFRALVKDLVSVFRMRIELRQIGVRDESRMLGGMAVCGRDYCCHGITDHLNPVSIKMAKEQNLSLNSMKISGPCGRLLCCLSYEFDFYREEKSRLPNTGSRLKIRDELLKITEVNILSRKYYLTASDGRVFTIPFEKVVYNNETGRWDVNHEYIEEVLSL